MSASPGACSPSALHQTQPPGGMDYFNITSRDSIGSNSSCSSNRDNLDMNLFKFPNISTPQDVTLSLSGSVINHQHQKSDDAKSDDAHTNDFYFKKMSRTTSSPLIHRKWNESLSSIASDSTVGDSFFLRNKGRDDLMGSTHTLVEDLPTKMTLELPKLSINENTESEFNFTRLNDHKGVVLNQPPLTKHLSSPSLKTIGDFPKRMSVQTQDYSQQILNLSPTIKLLNRHDLELIYSQIEIIDDLKLPNLLTLDIRSFTDYAKSHLQNAINICLPTTLLKRPTFSFKRCINSLPLYEKLIVKTYLNFSEQNLRDNKPFSSLGQLQCGQHGFPAILLYDSQGASYNAFCMIKKLLEEFQPRKTPIYVVADNFNTLSSFDTLTFDSGSKQHFNINDLMTNDNDAYKDIIITETASSTPSPQSQKFRSHSLNEIQTLKSISPLESSTPVISNFKMPSTLKAPNFKIRHNEEVLTSGHKLGIDLIKKHQSSLAQLPNWMNTDYIQEDALVKAFNELESQERQRLNDALDLKTSFPMIGAGIEKGFKNRYKDILLYEHSRVKLQDFQDLDPNSTCDYINASYIESTANLSTKPKETDCNSYSYIATQGPLDHTIGDFYKCLINNQTSIIVCLTDVWENGMPKCNPYWESGVYTSNGDSINVTLKNTEKVNNNIILRSIQVEGQIQGESFEKTFIQIQLLLWMDNSTCDESDDLLFVIELRDKLVHDLNLKNYNTLVHCSAGCGRTGTFITIDTIVNLLHENYNFDTSNDMIPLIVNNLRCQRISMVQNLRQFIFVYDMLINYLTKPRDYSFDFPIVNEFKHRISS